MIGLLQGPKLRVLELKSRRVRSYAAPLVYKLP